MSNGITLSMFQPDQILVAYVPGGPSLITASELTSGLQTRLATAFRNNQIPVLLRVKPVGTLNFIPPAGSSNLPFRGVLRLHITPSNFAPAAARVLNPQQSESDGYVIEGRRGSARITGAGPNWVTSAAPGYGTTGCPGSTPEPQGSTSLSADFDKMRSYPEFNGIFTVPDKIPIYVLDTAPNSRPTLAHAKSIAGSHKLSTNPLIRRLIGKDGPVLNFIPINFLAGSPADSAGAIPVPYCLGGGAASLPYVPGYSDESDHGIFVAGIIEMLTKMQKITLMRVLNKFGVGDTFALLAALAHITYLNQKRARDIHEDYIPILVNLSLLLNFPKFNAMVDDDFSQFSPATQKNLTPADKQWLKMWAARRAQGVVDSFAGPDAHIISCISALYTQRIALVAAAGNDSSATFHLNPRYPAAYSTNGAPKVFSAAGITTTMQPSSFSNKGDFADLSTTMPSHGVALWGGEVDQSASCDPLRKPLDGWVSAGIQKNVTRIHPSTSPGIDHIPNLEGWLQWAGTSFATPALTAWVARYMAAQIQAPPTVPSSSFTLDDVFTALMNRAANIPGQPESGANYLSVVQAPSVMSMAMDATPILLRRAGFGLPHVSSSLDTLLDPPRLTLPEDRATSIESWLAAMVANPNPLREKLALFWHTLFGVGLAQAANAGITQQWQRLITSYRDFGGGLLTPLLQSITANHAVLAHFEAESYWQGQQNPDYAREILDRVLGHRDPVTGEAAYSEADVAQAAKLLVAGYHEDGQWASGIEIAPFILAKPATARSIARQMWRFFAGTDAEPAPALVERLAQTYRGTQYDALTLLRAIFNAPEFAQVQGVKSPLDYSIGALRDLGYTHLPADMPHWLAAMGQDISAPPLAGWPIGAGWLTPDTQHARLDFARTLAHDPAFVPLATAESIDTIHAYGTRLLHTDVSPAVRSALAGASPQTVAAALIAMPEYQRL